MNHLSHLAPRAPVLLTLLTCVLSVLAISKPVICQQTPSKPPAPTSSQQQNAKPLVLTVTVTNEKGAYAIGLGKSNFTVLDEKAAQDITYFKGMDEPISIGIMLDLSGSMGEQKKYPLTKDVLKEALSQFIRQSNQSNEYFVIGFNERAQLLLDWTRDVNDVGAALSKVDLRKPKGQTALYDTCYLGIEKLTRSTHPKRALILITDGLDSASRYSLRDVRRLLKESNVLIYSVAIRGIEASYYWLNAEAILDEFALISGGVAYYPKKQPDTRTVFDLIAAELRHQYSIGFNPASYPGDREWHRIKVKLALPSDAPRELKNLSVRSREGYYPDLSLLLR